MHNLPFGVLSKILEKQYVLLLHIDVRMHSVFLLLNLLHLAGDVLAVTDALLVIPNLPDFTQPPSCFSP